MNNDDKILKALEDLKADVTSIKDVQQEQGDVQQKQGKQIDMLVDTNTFAKDGDEAGRLSPL